MTFASEKKLKTKLVFESGHVSAYGGLGNSHLLRCFPEAADFADAVEDLDLTQRKRKHRPPYNSQIITYDDL